MEVKKTGEKTFTSCRLVLENRFPTPDASAGGFTSATWAMPFCFRRDAGAERRRRPEDRSGAAWPQRWLLAEKYLSSAFETHVPRKADKGACARQNSTPCFLFFCFLWKSAERKAVSSSLQVSAHISRKSESNGAPKGRDFLCGDAGNSHDNCRLR